MNQMSDADKAFIRGNSVEIQEGTGETIVRKRLDTSVRPASFDADFGEVGVKAEEQYLELELVGKVLDLSEDLMVTDFGGSVSADAIVHVPFASDVVTGDYLVIRSVWYEVGPAKESALKSYLALAVTRRSAAMVSGGGGGITFPTLTPGQMLKANNQRLPSDATNTDAEVADAVAEAGKLRSLIWC